MSKLQPPSYCHTLAKTKGLLSGLYIFNLASNYNRITILNYYRFELQHNRLANTGNGCWNLYCIDCVNITTFPCSVQMRIYPKLTVIRSMGTIKIITWYAFNNATWESVLVRIPQYFYCVLITMPVTTSNYHSWLSNSVRPSANDHSKHGTLSQKHTSDL